MLGTSCIRMDSSTPSALRRLRLQRHARLDDEHAGLPRSTRRLAIVTELVAPFALIVGLGGRLAALGIIGLMAGALSTHAPNGFFMNWFGGLPAGTEGSSTISSSSGSPASSS
jgi:uncharacterized membrane protein YphA (DoxX/SURF4 family)